jgi:ABC-2 type transport system permease protein
MRKIFVIAMREYLAAVRSKAFVITLVLMPIMMGGSIGLSLLFKKLDDAKEKKYAVIDLTKGQKLLAFLQLAEKRVKEAREKDPKNTDLANFKVEFIAFPPPADKAELPALRYEISQKIEKGELEALIEIGPDVFEVPREHLEVGPGGIVRPDSETPEEFAVRYQAKNVGALQFRGTLERILNEALRFDRLVRGGASLKAIQDAQVPVAVKSLPLTHPKPEGGFEEGPENARIVNLLLPAVLIALMFMVITVGATPAMHGIIEEKTLRIAEVLLGSVTPFQLMAGKLLGIIGVAFTMATVYLGGGYFTAVYFGFAEHLPLSLLVFFVPMLLLALLIFGSLFIAVGAAASDIKDTQMLLMPIMLMACIPFFALGPIIQDPNGPIARVCSFFPFATPMLLVARQSVPPGVPAWEMAAGIVLVLATTFLCVWAAGRIFRVGILLQGKAPRFGDLIRWIIRG